VTDDVKKCNHRIQIERGVLQIVPNDNQNLLKALRSAVDGLAVQRGFR